MIYDVPTERLFGAGSGDLQGTTSMFTPKGFKTPELLKDFARVVSLYQVRRSRPCQFCLACSDDG